ncbi:MAG: glycosyl transferase [Gemmataceae bacterium]|nr:glycosyl transferase [Gemmataceae bacterium]
MSSGVITRPRPRPGSGAARRRGTGTAFPQLSVVIPAFNEAGRLGAYLAEVRAYLDAAYPGDYEVLVVDDGSADDTAGLVRRAAAGWPRLRLVRHAANRGKGAAVRTGVLAAAGRRVLFADADGATPIAEERRLTAAVAAGAAVAVGSRYAPGPGVTRERNLRRAVAGAVFRWAARRLIGAGVRDTQCGFKMFEAAAGRALFATGVETGYLFDLEALVLAKRFGYPVAEVAVNWAEQPGSKVRVFRDGWRMLGGLWRLRDRVRGLPAPPTPRPHSPRGGSAAPAG